MKLPYWRFLVPLFFQITIVVGIAISPLWTVLTGNTVILRTIPIDPYDFLRGYSQVLDYEFSWLENLRKLPGGEILTYAGKSSFYLILQAPPNPNSIPPQPWQPIRVVDRLPDRLPPDQVAIKGKVQPWARATYGIEEIYIPEDQRDQINEDVNEANRKEEGAVEVKVDRSGQAIVQALWLGSRRLKF